MQNQKIVYLELPSVLYVNFRETRGNRIDYS